MRKLTMVMALALVLVPLFAAVALAEGQLIQCKNVLPCTGGSGDDKILERVGDGKDDQILPKGGDDLVLANKYTADTDVVGGGGGRDRCIVDAKREAGTSCASVDVQRP
jgi:hypothetical protein